MAEKSLPEVVGEVVAATSEAEKAKWETIGKGIEAGSGLGRFLDRVLGPALVELGGIAGDRVRFWRLMQAQKLAERFREVCDERGVDDNDLKALPLSQTFPLIEAASMEDSDEVQDLWAKLLASAMDARTGVSIKKVYIALLKEIGPAEAALLDVLYRFGPERVIQLNQLGEVTDRLTAIVEEKWRVFPSADRLSAIANLRRLGCVAPDIGTPQIANLVQRIRLSDRQIGGRRAPEIGSVDPNAMVRLVNWMLDAIMSASGSKPTTLPDEVPLHDQRGGWKVGKISVPEFALQLTPLGSDLMTACWGGWVPKQAKDAAPPAGGKKATTRSPNRV